MCRPVTLDVCLFLMNAHYQIRLHCSLDHFRSHDSSTMSLHNKLLLSDDDLIHQALELLDDQDFTTSSNHIDCDLLPALTHLDEAFFEVQLDSDDNENSLQSRPPHTNKQNRVLSHPLRDSSAPPRRINKRKAELHQLRRRVHQLEQQLEALRGRCPASEEPSRVNTRQWHDIATSELKRLKVAENENLRLKKLLQQYKRVYRQVRRHVTKEFVTMQQHNGLVPNSSMQADVDMSPLIRNPALFPLLLDSIWGMQLRTDVVLAAQHLPLPRGTCRDVNTELTNGTEIMVRIVDSRVIPFPYSSVVAATWKQSFELDGINRVAWEDLGGETFQGKLNTHADICMFSNKVQGKVVMRRIDEPDRVVIFRSGQYVCGESAHACQPIWNQQWVVVSKLSPLLAEPHTACQLTTDDICLHMVPPASSLNASSQEDRFAHVTQAYVDSSTQRLEKSKDTIDTLLLLRRC